MRNAQPTGGFRSSAPAPAGGDEIFSSKGETTLMMPRTTMTMMIVFPVEAPRSE